MTRRSGSRPRHALALLVAILLCVFWIRGLTGSIIRSDDTATLLMGLNLQHHGVLSMDEAPPYTPSMYREPFPALIAAIMVRGIDASLGKAERESYFSGERARWLKYQNVVWLLLLCGSTYFAVLWLTSTAALGIAAAVLAQAVFFYPGMRAAGVDTLFSDIPAAAMLTLASLLLAKGTTGSSWRYSALSGLCFGILALIKASMLYVFAGLFVVIAALCMIRRRQQDVRKSLLAATMLLSGFVAVVSPWIYRNYAEFGAAAVADRGGLSLYTRALKDRMSTEEYRGSFYVWAPRPLRPAVGALTGFGPDDLRRGGRLQHLNHSRGTADFLSEDAQAEWMGRPQDAISYYYRGRAELVRLRQEFAAAGAPHPWMSADRTLTRQALAVMREHPFEHVALMAPLLWRGALVAFPLLALAVIVSLRRRNHALLLFTLPAFGLIMFYASLANFEQRYGVPAFPVAVAALLIVINSGNTMFNKLKTLMWFLKRPKLYPQLLRMIGGKLSGRRASAQSDPQEAVAWCAGRALDTGEALRKITGAPMKDQVTKMHPQIFAAAQRAAAECPVSMGGPGDLDLIYGLAEHSKAEKIIETGVAYGWSSLALLLSLRNRPAGRLVSNDMPYPNRNNDRYVGCVVPAELRSQWQLLRYADRQGLPKALHALGGIDMCHYDSDKSYKGRMWAYPLLWQSLRAGGFLISDDIGDNVAFRDFCRQVAMEPVIVGRDEKYIGVLAKPGGT